MLLTRHDYLNNFRWALDGKLLPKNFSLKMLLELKADSLVNFLKAIPAEEEANSTLISPVEPEHEVWACGVTYAHSRDAREVETEVKNIYQKVYDARRPEIFFKANGWRTVGHKGLIRIRKDTTWNVPEPELVLVMNCLGEIVGYSAGNDVSSRDIEGENPLYLPQAKTYEGSCAIGPGIILAKANELRDLLIELEIIRNGDRIFEGSTRTSKMKRSFEELIMYLTSELTFPFGAFIMTGTGIVPPEKFTLHRGDLVRIKIGKLTLENVVGNN